MMLTEGYCALAKRRGILVVAIVTSFVVSACGGGGGGGKSRNPNATFSLNASPVSITADELAGPQPPVQIDGSVTGATDNVFVTVIIPSNGMFKDGTLDIFGTTGTLTLVPEDPDVLGVGIYTGNIQVQVCNDAACTSQISGSPRSISATYEVTATQLTFSAAQADLVAEHRQDAVGDFDLDVSAGPTDWTAAISYNEGSDWLALSPGSGSQLPAQVTLTASGQSPGVYTANVEFSTDAGTATLGVPVSYTVEASEIDITETALSFSLSESSIPADLVRSLDVRSGTPGVDYDWTVTTDVRWLSLSADSGNTSNATPLDVAIDPWVVELDDGDHQATISLVSPDPAASPVDIPVTLSKSVRSARFVAPYAQLVGTVTPLTVTGAGFSTILPGELTIDGSAVSDFNVISDTELVINAPLPAVAGRYLISLPDTTGLPLNTAELVVSAPAAFGAFEMPLVNRSRGLKTYDPERRILYASHGSTLERFTFDGSTWTMESFDMPNVFGGGGQTINRVRVSVDGKELYMQLRQAPYIQTVRLDADSLDVIAVLPDTYRPGPLMEILNNGYTLSDEQHTANLRLETGRASISPINGFVDSARDRASATGDGSRAYFRFDSAQAGETDLFYYDTRSNTVVDTGLVIGGVFDLNANKDGSVLLVDRDVYDADMNLLGTLGTGFSARVSLDGSAAFFMGAPGATPNTRMFHGKNLAAPDGNGGYADLFAPFEIQDDALQYRIAPELNAIIFVGADVFRVVPLP